MDPQFEKLAAQWRAETGGWSNARKILEHMAYRRIVAMGWAVVPSLLAELARGDADLWGPALREITGKDVAVAPDDIGRLDVVGKAWLALADAEGWR